MAVVSVRENHILKNESPDHCRLFIQSCLSTFVISMLAHAFAYFNLTLNNDRYSILGDNSAMRYSGWSSPGISEKWFAKTGLRLTARTYLPWLDGVWFIVFMALSVLLICEVFEIRKTLSVWLISGLFCTDFAIVTGHFYTPYSFSQALFLACLSVWIWKQDRIRWWLRIILTSVLISMVLGVYGAYVSVAPTTVVLLSIMALLSGQKIKTVLLRGVEFIFSFGCGGLLELLILRHLIRTKHTTIQSYGGEDNITNGGIKNISEIAKNAVIGYRSALEWLIKGREMMPQWVAVILLVAGVCMLAVIICKNRTKPDGIWAWILIGLLFVVYPLSAGFVYILSFNTVHWLMKFTAVIIYVGVIKCLDVVTEEFDVKSVSDDIRNFISGDDSPTPGRIPVLFRQAFGQGAESVICVVLALITILISVFFIYDSIVTANAAYVRYENVYEESKNTVVRLIERIESCEGFTGDEQIVFYGFPYNNKYISESRYEDSKGVITRLDNFPFISKEKVNAWHHPTQMPIFAYAVTDLNLDMQYYHEGVLEFEEDQMKIVESMPEYPAQGSIRKISDDRIVVKLCDWWGW